MISRDLLETIYFSSDYYDSFLTIIKSIENLIEIEVDPELERDYFMMLYSRVITAMEVYLADAFIQSIIRDRKLFRKFVENYKGFTEIKFPISEVFTKIDSIDKTVFEELISMTWHNLNRVEPLYKSVLSVNFPEDLADVYKAISKRHDIVHRNGKTKKDGLIEIDRDAVEHCIHCVESFIRSIDESLPQKDDSAN